MGSFSPSIEVFAREEDLVAVYPASTDYPFRTTLQWSGYLDSGWHRITLTLSLQTDLLDARPELVLSSPAEDVPECLAGGLWVIVRDSDKTVAIAPHPSDAVDATVRVVGDACIVGLSPPFLEKGVIRRCRVAAFVATDKANDHRLAAALAAFDATPPPLTA